MTGLQPYPAYGDSGVEWLGKVPEHWRTVRAKRLFRKMDRPVRPDDEVVTCFRDGTVTLRRNRRELGFTESLKEIGYQGVRRGRSRNPRDGCLRRRLRCRRFGREEYAGVCGLCTEGRECELSLLRILCSGDGQEPVDSGSLKRRERAVDRLSLQATFGNQWVPVPPSREQATIVRFLDHTDRRIRRYIRAKEGLIELLEEQKQAIILQAVTGQIDVRTGQPYPAYKDSGVEWLGEVPEHWGMVANKAMLSRRKVLVGENHTQFRLLSLTKSGVIVRDLSTGRGKFSADMGTSQEVWKGDLVFCLFDVPETPRTIGLSGHDGMITGAYTVFECDRPLLRQFLEAFYIAMDDRKLLEPLYSGLRNTIPPSRFLGAKTPVPSRDEQGAILGYLHDSRTVADSAVTLAEREVDLLNEYRTRLIADVVTGKLDVREAAASLPEVDPLASDETRSAPEPNAATALESPELALPLPHP